MGEASKDLTGVINLPGFGTARTFDRDNRIFLQAYGSDEVTFVEEPEALSISGVLRIGDDRFCTWSGRKRGDSALRIWTAIDGDWHLGVKLHARLQGHSRWIHTVTPLQERRVASCGEDDAIRVWDFDVREPDLPKPVAANVPRYVGSGYWRVHLHGYSNTGTRRPLVLVDALGGQARVVDEIWYAGIPNEVTVQQGLAVVENEAVVDQESQVIDFELSANDDVVKGVSRAKAKMEVVDRDLILAVRKPAEDAGEGAAFNLTAWGLSIFGYYCEAAHLELTLPRLRPLVHLPDHRFAAWGDTDRIEIWRVSLKDFGEREVFQPVAQVHPLPSAPEGVVAVDGQVLLVWGGAGWLLQVRVQDGQVMHRQNLPGLVGFEVAPGLAPLGWDRSGQVWRLDLATGQAQVLVRSPDADVIGLVALTATDFISMSTDGCLRRWTIDGAEKQSTVLFPGRFMSKAEFFWSLYPEEEDAGLAAGNPIRDAEGNVLMMTSFVPAAFALLLYTRASDALHLLLIDEDRVRVFDATNPRWPLCVWHFARSSYRDPNLELGLSPAGEVVVLAGTALQRLQLMRGTRRLRLDALND
jgi:WD40 repeat protein